MTCLLTCGACKRGDHKNCEIGQSPPQGVFGGWACNCQCRRRKQEKPTQNEISLDEARSIAIDALEAAEADRLPKPPEGYESWLDYAVDTMETRELYHDAIWKREPWNRADFHNASKTELEALRQRIAELEARQRWIPVEERLPKVEIPEDHPCGMIKVLGVTCHGWVAEAEFIQWVGGVVCKGSSRFYYGSTAIKTTHWMPLPEPPKESN